MRKGGGGTRREEGGWRGIYVQRDQGEIEIETSGGGGHTGRGMKGFEVAIARNSRFARLRASAETAICIGNYTG